MNNIITSLISIPYFNLLKSLEHPIYPHIIPYIHPVDVMTLFVSAAQAIEMQDKKVRNNVK